MFHVKHQGWAEDLRSLGYAGSPDTFESLMAFEAALRGRAIPRGYVAVGDAERLWDRHILDSLRALPEISPEARVADLGSGAGLPGIPLAIAKPDCSFTLIEMRRGRAAFLESVVDDLDLRNTNVLLGKIATSGGPFDVCLARAFSGPTASWIAAEPLLGATGQLVSWAGSGFDEDELAGSVPSWRLSTPSGLAEPGPLVIMGRQ
jgi:16S rRNA (guanine527-N7)-methyltransferase